MDENITIWLVGNTGLRNPNRIYDGFKAFSESSFVGNLHGKENEIGFTKYLNQKGIIQNSEGKDLSGSHARKWRLMFARNGFIYPQVSDKYEQDELGKRDEVTPFGRSFLSADTFPAVQEMFLRSLSVEQYAMPDGKGYFSPLRWIIAIMLELEKRTGRNELSRLEFALWGHTTNPSYDLNWVVDHILDLRVRRNNAKAKHDFDKQEIKKRSINYINKASNFLDYSDMNMRYLRITGILQRKGRGIMIVPEKHLLAEMLAKTTPCFDDIRQIYRVLCYGAPLPIDNMDVAMSILRDLEKQLLNRNISFCISDLEPFTSASKINIARRRLEDILSKVNEINYAIDQRNKWQEISDYMSLLIKGGGKIEYNDENFIEVPKDETAAYLEWTLWRAGLAIDHLVNKPYEMRGFIVDSDFMPISTARGGRGDLYYEFENCTILTEVTMSQSSRQEAMEGEPVRRHVSDATFKYIKPVYGLFISVKIDTNTAETFRHGIWYTSDDKQQRLNIVPISLAQFQRYFVMMFKDDQVHPNRLVALLEHCLSQRDSMDAREWKVFINHAVDALC